MAGGVMDLWNEWATQILVLLSLTLQVILHLFAKIRRRKASSFVQRLLLWLSYQLADSTATYAVGQLFFNSTPRDHHLVAFWAPFLLLHLGGPDNITAYSLEDNKLWTRHFVTFVVQVLGAGYVLYKHIAGTGMFLLLASILISIVSVAKYGERTWALWCANFSSLQSSLKAQGHNKNHQHFYVKYEGDNLEGFDNELLLQYAHSLFHICKRAIVDSVVDLDPSDAKVIRDFLNGEDRERLWTVMEMELSLLYDILYTKASVTHSYFGYFIRIVSPLAISTSLVLFQLSGKDGHSRVDIIITYILLGGALILEIKSLLSALGSSWALAFLCKTRWNWLRHAAMCTGRWHRLRRALISLRQSGPGKMMMIGRSSRRWSGTMGQYNMLQFCTGQEVPLLDKLGKLSKQLRFGNWWDRRYYSGTVMIPEKVKKRAQHVKKFIPSRDINTLRLLRHTWGKLGLGAKGKKYPGLWKKLKDIHGVDFHESIIIWHIATDLILARRQVVNTGHDATDDVDAIRVMSNYMMFLLVDRPYMLPGLPQNWLYEQTCNNLNDIRKNHPQACSSEKDTTIYDVLKKFFGLHHQHGLEPSDLDKNLATVIYNLPPEDNPSDSKMPRIMYAHGIAHILHYWEEVDEVAVLLDLWTDFLVYASNRCSRESHARKLSSGGEFITVLWLMIEHLCEVKIDAKEGPGDA